MNKYYRVLLFLLFSGLAACVSTQSPVQLAGNDEDEDVGLGGTGLLAETDTGAGGIGGTGITGVITGYGSIFVNGIEIEYDDETPFTIDGESVPSQNLEIGDVVDVLTVDSKQYTHAQIINLRHEIIGVVESVEPQTYSFNINGQSIVQPVNKSVLPEVGSTVAVSGFRIDEKTVLSTRVKPADIKQSLVRAHTELPYKDRAARWLIQKYVKDGDVRIHLGSVAHEFKLDEGKVDKGKGESLSDRLGIKILGVNKLVSGRLVIDQVIDPVTVPRGSRIPVPAHQPINNRMQYEVPGASPGAAHGSAVGNHQNQSKTPQGKR
jgi:hypothetical protein